jgi:hypothetical protein
MLGQLPVWFENAWFFFPLREGILFFVFWGFGCDLIQKRIGEGRDTDGLNGNRRNEWDATLNGIVNRLSSFMLSKGETADTQGHCERTHGHCSHSQELANR